MTTSGCAGRERYQRSSAGPCALAVTLALMAACFYAPVPPRGSGTPVWVDTDPAIGEPDRDVDDGMALVQAFRSPTLDVRGVSVVFGNTPLVRAWPIAQDVVGRVGPEGFRPWRGAAGPDERDAPTEASEALATMLREERLTVILLGPATNIASMLRRDPALASRIEHIVAVAGRRPGQRFTTGTTNPRGHRDLNFELDVEAFRVILASGVPLTLAPFELSSQVWISEEDIHRLAAGPAHARFLADPARAWLRVWKEAFDVDGFNPFDTLAIDVVAHPGEAECEAGLAFIERHPDDETEARMQGTDSKEKDYLIVRPPNTGNGRPVTYCHTPDEGFKERLMNTLLTP
jgi:inosine-uridine nucleoside N-ribohydrolase